MHFCVYLICETLAHRHSSNNLCEFYQWIISNPSNISSLPSATNELKMINTINKGKRIFPLFPKERGSLTSRNVFLYSAKFPKWTILLLAWFIILPKKRKIKLKKMLITQRTSIVWKSLKLLFPVTVSCHCIITACVFSPYGKIRGKCTLKCTPTPQNPHSLS